MAAYTSYSRRGLGLTALLFLLTLGAYLPLWLYRALAQLRSVHAGSTRLSPGFAAGLAVLPLANVIGLTYLAVDLPRGLRRAAGERPAGRQVEPEVMSMLALGAVAGGIALTVLLGLPAPVAGYLAWPLELPLAVFVQRQLNAFPVGDEAHTDARDRETLAALAIGAVVLVGAGLVVALSTSEDGSAPVTRAAPGPATPDPASASDLAVSPDALWVTLNEADRVKRLDLRTRRPAGGAIRVGREPLDLAAANGVVWVANRTSGTVIRIDWTSGKPIGHPIPTGRAPWGLAIGLGGVWVSNQVERTVVKLEPRTGRPAGEPTRVGVGPRGVATGEGAVWVANFDGQSVSRVDPRSRSVREIRIGGAPQDVAAGAGGVWVTRPREGLVSVLNSQGRRVGAPIQIGGMPASVEVGLGWVWVANAGTGTVQRIDPRTRRTAGRPVRVGGSVADITIGQGAVWALRTDGTVRRLESPPRP